MTTFILKDVQIFTGEATISAGFIHVENGKIKAVGPASETPESSNTQVISRPGHTLIPGLIDAHIHVDKANPVALTQSLRFGVTTVCDMQNELANVQKLHKQKQESDTADYKTAGQAATIENGWPIPVITAHDKSEETLAEIATWPKLKDAKDVEEYLDWNQREMQPDYIKLMHESGKSLGMQLPRPTPELQKIIIDASRKRGLLTVAHALSLQDTLDVLNAGVDGLMHTFLDQAPTEELVAAYKKNNAWLNPTLAAIGSLTKEGAELQERFAHDPRVAGLIGDKEKGNLCKCMGMAAETCKVEYAYESVKRLRKEGIDIICGSDSAGPALGTAWGLSMHQELYVYVHKVGMTPEEALRSATSVTAKRFRFPDRGRLAEGLRADLVLVEGDPLADIDATLDLRGVWREGVLCSVYKEKLHN